jgi:hypothetical protein
MGNSFGRRCFCTLLVIVNVPRAEAFAKSVNAVYNCAGLVAIRTSRSHRIEPVEVFLLHSHGWRFVSRRNHDVAGH